MSKGRIWQQASDAPNQHLGIVGSLYYIFVPSQQVATTEDLHRERSGSVVECLTQDREAAG